MLQLSGTRYFVAFKIGRVFLPRAVDALERRHYPVCIGGQRAGPPEDCGGPQAFAARRLEAPWRVGEILDQLREALSAEDEDAVWEWVEELRSWHEWLSLDTFDRRTVNRRLRQYGAGNDEWQWE